MDDLVEKPDPKHAPSRYAVIGRYVLSPDIFDILRRIPPGKNGEIQLTDALRVLAKKVDNVSRMKCRASAMMPARNWA